MTEKLSGEARSGLDARDAKSKASENPRSGERVYECCNEFAGVKGRDLVEFEKNSATSLIFVLSLAELTDVRV